MRAHRFHPRLAAASIATLLPLLGCGAARFEATCESVNEGMSLDRARKKLEAAGGSYVGKVGPEHQWFRPIALSFDNATCRVRDDTPPNPVAPDPSRPLPKGAKVLEARYSESGELL